MKLAWSNLAKGELQALRRFSVERWGADVTQRYLEDVRAAARKSVGVILVTCRNAKQNAAVLAKPACAAA